MSGGAGRRAAQHDGGAVGEDEHQIHRTLGAYCQHYDDGRFDEWADLFTDAAAFEFPGRRARGREAIRSLMETVHAAGPGGKHMTANTLVDVDGDSASATTDYLFVQPEGGGLAIVAAGRYHDRLVRSDGRWRFAERVITMVGDEGDAGGG